MKRPRWLPAILAVLAAVLATSCTAEGPVPPKAPATQTSGDNSADFGAVSVDVPPPPKRRVDITKTTEWPDATLESGTASLSCSIDYVTDGDGPAFSDLSFFTVLDAMLPCKDAKVVRLRYRGRIAGDFTTLIERVATNPRERPMHLGPSIRVDATKNLTRRELALHVAVEDEEVGELFGV